MRYVLRYLMIVLYTVFWGTLALLLSVVDRSGESVIWVARNWIRWILVTCGVRVEVSGLEHHDPARAYVVMANHRSVWDTAALVATLPASFRFVAKRELTWIPFFGWALAAGGHVIIDRSNREASVRSLERAAARVRGGKTVVIFPEGTRQLGSQLGEFKSGGFHLALAAQVPILPASVSGSSRITPPHSLRIESGRIHVRYGEPIPTAGLTVDDRQRLKEVVRDAIAAGLEPDLDPNRSFPGSLTLPEPRGYPEHASRPRG
jgi:1-acyl-sn-glycerol-3-phosphate acyltransferase